jgi:hypothetical protein
MNHTEIKIDFLLRRADLLYDLWVEPDQQPIHRELD